MKGVEPREGEQSSWDWEGVDPWTPAPDLSRVLLGRKMKPLLPRVSSYLVPIQFPVNQSLVLQPSVKVPLPLAASLMSSELARHSKRVRIAPKVSGFRFPLTRRSSQLKALDLWFASSLLNVPGGAYKSSWVDKAFPLYDKGEFKSIVRAKKELGLR